MYQIYKIVRIIITVITEIQKVFDEISKAIKKIEEENKKIHDFMSSPPSLGSLINDVEQRGFEFEKNSGWNAGVGAARIAMLPSA
jgi:hypothetical protein